MFPPPYFLEHSRMKIKTSLLTLATAIVISSVTTSHAYVSKNPESFWNTNEEGWWWYKQDLNRVKPKKKEEKPKVVVAQTKKTEKKKRR